MRTLLCFDIDNTLIYSLRHPHAGWPCVEWIHEREQAYMSPRTLALYGEALAAAALVPVTSRSIAQYARLRLPKVPSMAVTANGADLLIDGAPDAGWRRETDALIAPWRGELDRLLAALGPSPRYLRCRRVDDAYGFVYCEDGVAPADEAASIAAQTGLCVSAAGRKIYLLPPPLHKGAAVERLRARLHPECCIAAGDGPMDLPMLRAADRAIAPAALAAALPEGACICPERALFSEFALETALTLCRRDQS